MPEPEHKPLTPSPATLPRQRLSGPVIVGVVPGQPAAVIRKAADLAYSLGVLLLLAHVDVDRYPVSGKPDDGRASALIDPGGLEEDEGTEILRTHLAGELASGDVPWEYVQLAGEPAKALGWLATDRHACFVVVGTREGGFEARLEEILKGSLAVRLSHRQKCPVIVIPLSPHSNWDHL